MTSIALTFLALVCSIFGSTSEVLNHGSECIPSGLYDNVKQGINPNLGTLYGNEETSKKIRRFNPEYQMRHYNLNDRKKREDTGIQYNHINRKAKEYGVNTNLGDNNAMRHYNPKTDRKAARMGRYINARDKREISDDPRCKPFTFEPDGKTRRLTHPRDEYDMSKPGEGTYSSNTTCFTTIEAPDEASIIVLTFVEMFEIEYSPECKNDYLEIRDGRFGYAEPVYIYCGKSFPPTLTSTGPYLWLKFYSDENIEYAGFTIDIEFPMKPPTRRISHECYISLKDKISGQIDLKNEDTQKCRDQTPTGPLDVQWRIETAEDTRIYLNVSVFQLHAPNNCTKNTVQVFVAEPNVQHLLGNYCSSVADSIVTHPDKKYSGPLNVMYVRMLTMSRLSNFSATFTQFRIADSCDKNTEFDCKDGTCIDRSLRCDSTGMAHCRLKADEDPAECKGEAESLLRDKDTRTILIIFSLTLSGMVAVFLFKCIRKVYSDQKQINKHRADLIKDFMDKTKTQSQLTLDPMSRRRGSRSSSGLGRQYYANEVSRHRSEQKSSSLESDLLRMPVDNDDWPESEPLPILPENLRYKGRPTRDLSKKEESLRGNGSREDTENRDVSLGHPHMREADCQTRDSLFQTHPLLPRTVSDVSGPDSRVASFVALPAPAPAPAAAAPQLTIELLRQATAQDTSTTSSQGERPTSSETTKSAPDVIQIY